MSRLVVCPLSRLAETVSAANASHLVSVMRNLHLITRPGSIEAARHLQISVDDIAEDQAGLEAPRAAHVESLIAFVSDWDRAQPLVIHCYAGISRSTAAAYIAACALNPSLDERAIAARLRASSEMATPNPLLVAHADRHLGRKGRMIEAIAAIGRGTDAFEGTPFSLTLDDEK